MDTLTHLLVGHAMGAAASSAAGPHGAAAYWAALIGNSLPDIDVPFSLLIRRDIKLHRTFTHTLPGAVLLSLLGAVAVQLIVPEAGFRIAFFWTLLGCLMHMAMDCLNLWGARMFWPLVPKSIDLAVLHILDPVLLVLLGLPSLGVMLGMAETSLLSLAFYLMFPYITYRLIRANRLYNGLKTDAMRARIIPWYSSWRYVIETEDRIEFGRWDRGRRSVMEVFHKEDSPLIEATMNVPEVAAFLRSAEYPYAQVEADEVVWGDAVRRLRADFRPVRVRIGN